MLTEENYRSPEKNKEYLSVSQYKDFCGTLGQNGCEDMAMAKINGLYEQERTEALTIGSYVDAHFEGTLDRYKAKNYGYLFQKNGAPREKTTGVAERVIRRIEQDEFFLDKVCAEGDEQQVIMETEMFGTKWKIKIDNLRRGKFITDLKVMSNIRKGFFVRDLNERLSLIEYWGYDIQAAVYQRVAEINTGTLHDFFFALASKEKSVDIEVVQMPNKVLSDVLKGVEENTARILSIKAGEIEPSRCGFCDWCRQTKKLTEPIWPEDLIFNNKR